MITEKELENLFRNNKKPKKGVSWIRALFIFALVFIATVIIINFPAFSSNFSYWFETEIKNNSFENPNVNNIALNNQSANSIVNEVSNNSVYIDKLDLRAPIIFDVNNDAQSVKDALEKGIIHLKGTAHPGEIGNVFITGHSSNYVWAQGQYNHIFSRLPNLDVNDNVTINYNNIIYIYQVTSKYIVSASDIDILKQGASSELTLMTCYPIGTNINRLVVRAKQIKPDSAYNQKKNPSSLDSLPDIKR